MGRLILITGDRGAGKTRFCTLVARRMQQRGFDVAGMLSPARFEGTLKVGIDALDLRSNQIRPLAQLIETNPQSATQTGHWAFDDLTLAWGDGCLRSATPCDLLIVDELGPLEFIHAKGWLSGLVALDSFCYRLALAVIRPELMATAQTRWPDCGVFRIGG